MASGYGKRTLRELAVIIFSRWLTILLITAIITCGTVLACVFSKKVYRSEVTLWARQSKQANPLEDRPDPIYRLEVFLKTQQSIIWSDGVLRRTMARLKNPDLRVSPVDPETDTVASPEWDKWNKAVTDAASKFTGRDVGQFRRKVKVTVPGGEDIAKSEVFTIAVDQPEPPEQAQLAATILTQEYLMHRRALQSQMDTSSKDLLEKELKKLRENILGNAEKELAEFIQTKVKGNLLELGLMNRPNTEVNHQRIRTAFQEEMIRIDAEIREYQALQSEIKAQIPEKVTMSGLDSLTPEDLSKITLVIPEKVLSTNTIINKLKLKLADLIIDRNALSEQFTNDYKMIPQKTGEIFRTTCDIVRELVAELKAIDQHISTLKARKSEIVKQVNEKNVVIDELSSLYVQYESLQRDVELSRSLYDQKRKELLDAETARQMAQQEVLITRVDQASLPDPTQPVHPILWLYTLISLIVGLLIGTAWAFLADSYDHTVRTIDQAERYLGKPVIVTIPNVHGGIIQ